MAVRVVPDAKLELLLIHIYVVEVEVAELHKVSKDFLHHSKTHWFTLEPKMLRKVKVGKVKTRSQELPLIKYR